MNIQSSDNAFPPSKMAGPMLLAGFTDVPVIGMHTMCMSMSDNPIASPAKFPAPFLLSVVPKTTRTNTKVKNTSARKPPRTPTPGLHALAPVLVAYSKSITEVRR